MKYKSHTPKHLDKGFTLFGLLLYIVLTSVVLTALGELTLGVFSLNEQVDRDRSTLYTLSFLQARLGYAIEKADSITVPTVGTPSNTLSLDTGGGNETYYLDEGRLWIELSSSTKEPLTPESVVITGVLFEAIDSKTEKSPIRLRLQTAIHNPLRPDVLMHHSTTSFTWYPYEYK